MDGVRPPIGGYLLSLSISFHSFNMSAFKQSNATVARTPDGVSDGFATRNIATAAGLALGAGTVVAGAAILTAALPGQMVVAAGTTGVLLYVGDRQFNGKPIIPGRDGADAPVAAAPVADTSAA